MAGKLTEAQRRALDAAPYVGFPAGSNMWPFVCLLEGTSSEVDGEEIDQLLRDGLLAAVPLAAPILTDCSPNLDITPDCECSHDIVLTPAGRAALEREKRG